MSEVPQELADEAAKMQAAFLMGWLSWPEVIAWADDWIIRLTVFSDDLSEVSLSRSFPKDGAAALMKLAALGDEATIFPYLKKIWRQLFEDGQLDATAVARAAWESSGYADSDSENWMRIMRLQHFYDEFIADWHPDETSRAEAKSRLEKEVREYLGQQ